MAAPEDLTSLWEQAVADENWEEAALLEQRRKDAEALTEVGSGVQEQRAIISAELYWLGGLASRDCGPTVGPRDIM